MCRYLLRVHAAVAEADAMADGDKAAATLARLQPFTRMKEFYGTPKVQQQAEASNRAYALKMIADLPKKKKHDGEKQSSEGGEAYRHRPGAIGTATRGLYCSTVAWRGVHLFALGDLDAAAAARGLRMALARSSGDMDGMRAFLNISSMVI